MNTLSSHVLDTTLGRPASGLPLTLTLPNGDTLTGITEEDGRFNSWGQSSFPAGQYLLRFHCAGYLQEKHGNTFYPHIDIHFVLEQDGGHYHVPLLISPFGFSSYRGS